MKYSLRTKRPTERSGAQRAPPFLYLQPFKNSLRPIQYQTTTITMRNAS